MAKEEMWHKRQAMILAGQVPDNAEDALIVLRLATQLVSEFLTTPSLPKADGDYRQDWGRLIRLLLERIAPRC